jgi:hypothetical protein
MLSLLVNSSLCADTAPDRPDGVSPCADTVSDAADAVPECADMVPHPCADIGPGRTELVPDCPIKEEDETRSSMDEDTDESVYSQYLG